MSIPTPSNLQVLILSEEKDRALFGLHLALAAIASDTNVVVFFGLRSARWVCASHGTDGPIREALDQLTNHGAQVFCCSACSHKHCSSTEGAPDLVEGVQHGGVTSVVHRAAAYPTVTV